MKNCSPFDDRVDLPKGYRYTQPGKVDEYQTGRKVSKLEIFAITFLMIVILFAAFKFR